MGLLAVGYTYFRCQHLMTPFHRKPIFITPLFQQQPHQVDEEILYRRVWYGHDQELVYIVHSTTFIPKYKYLLTSADHI